MPNIETILRDHVTLQVECIDRIFLQGYVPTLQRSGQLVYFLRNHRGYPVASPALLGQMTDRFVAAIRAFALGNRIPIVEFKRDQRKDRIAKQRFARYPHQEGVVFIGVAQEKTIAFRSTTRRRANGSKDGFNFFRGAAMVNHYYFYILDREWGPGFIKFASYAPFGVRVCLNGHEWAKQQAKREGLHFEPLENGFLSCDNPERLQEICDKIGPGDVDSYFRRWLAQIPHPFSSQDREAGYRYQLSIWQMEFSLTQVFDRPLAGRQFFEEVLRENLDLGRPDRIQLLFGRQVKRCTPSSFRTRVMQPGVIPKLSVDYKHSRVKQYFKENRALRTETVINDMYDVGAGRMLSNLPQVRAIARNINRRLLSMERTSHNCAIAPRTFEAVVLPSEKDGQRVPGLRFGDPRTMAVLAGLCLHLPTHEGFSHKILRERVAALFDPGPAGYTAGRMTYDLRRMRLKGLIQRIPRRNRYVLTQRGRRVALFFTKTLSRILRPGLTRIDPGVPPDASDKLAAAYRRLDRTLDAFIQEANLAA